MRDLGRQRRGLWLHHRAAQIIQVVHERAIGHPTTGEVAGDFNGSQLETDSSLGFMVLQSVPALTGCMCEPLPLPAPLSVVWCSQPHLDFSFLIILISKINSHMPFLCDPHPFFFFVIHFLPLCKNIPRSFSGDIFIDKMPHKQYRRVGPLQAGSSLPFRADLMALLLKTGMRIRV